MNELSNLHPPPGSVRKRKRVGRGPGSGHGKTSTKGGKGQTARSGGKTWRGFEGGQMPIQRRLPKFGFKNPTRRVYATVNIGDLSRFASGTVVDPDLLKRERVLRKLLDGVKVLGDGEIAVALTVRAQRFSESARKKIEAAGGKAEVV